ncbi:DUF6011 domain-containing protein [Dietzia sp. 179-F 9C3 NHS]|uniref:DUF6011 domain-containing protein n=1 Tax=Dietzia sp. 179-F 9C3 NHS TaxID=3374295 RepID=UPI00387A174D
MYATRSSRPAGARQIALISDLLAELAEVGLSDTGITVEDVRSGSSAQASECIDMLIAEKRRAATERRAARRASSSTAPSRPTVAAGRYAVTLAGKLRFFRVDTPDAGRWSGYTFVTELAGDSHYAIKNPRARADVLAAIASDPAALARYGREIGVCGACGRTLTDETSRTVGLGPICRSRLT